MSNYSIQRLFDIFGNRGSKAKLISPYFSRYGNLQFEEEAKESDGRNMRKYW